MKSPIAYAGFTTPSEDTLQIAQKRIDICKRMTDALFEYLTFDIRIMMDVNKQTSHTPTCNPEMLVQATKEREQTQMQIEMVESSISDLPKSAGAIVEGSILLPLRAQLEQQEQYISMIQAELEK